MTKNTQEGLGRQRDKGQTQSKSRFQECDSRRGKLPSTSTISSTPISFMSSATNTDFHRKKNFTQFLTGHKLSQTGSINRPRSCPSFTHGEHWENANIPLENCGHCHKTTDNAFQSSHKDSYLELQDLGLGVRRDENHNIIISNIENAIDSHLPNDEENARQGTENPSPPLWTSLAMKERLSTSSLPHSSSPDGSVSQRLNQTSSLFQSVHSVTKNEMRGNEENRQRLLDNYEVVKPTFLNLSPGHVPVRSHSYQEFNINMKVGDEPVRYYLPGDFSVNCVNSDFETDMNNNGGASCEYEKQLKVFTAIKEFLKGKGFFRHENEIDLNISDETCPSSSILEEDAECEIGLRNNEESFDSSTDEECTDFDTDIMSSTEGRRLSVRPSNPVARVLEFGGTEHLIPILKDDFERSRSQAKEK